MKSKYERECNKRNRTRYNKIYYARTSNKYKPRQWTLQEIEMIMAHEKTDSELSRIIHHSVGAIQHKRHEIRKEMNDNKNKGQKKGES